MIRRLRAALAWLPALALCPSLAHALDNAVGGGAPNPLSVASLFQVIMGLALVLAVLVIGAWLVKRLNPLPRGAAGALRVVGGVAVGPRERVVMVELKDTVLVLGVAPGRVSTLHTLPRSAVAGAADAVADEISYAGFAARLKQAIERRS